MKYPRNSTLKKRCMSLIICIEENSDIAKGQNAFESHATFTENKNKNVSPLNKVYTPITFQHPPWL